MTHKSRNDKTSTIKFLMILTVILMVILVLGASYIIFKEVSKVSSPQQINVDVQEEVKYENDADEYRLITLVNADYPLSSNFKLNLVNFMNIKCDKEMVANLSQLLTDAKNEGFDFSLIKGYVDKDTQQVEYENKVLELMASGESKIKASAEALKTVQPGNCSEYQTGLAIDISKTGLSENEDFSQTKEFNWLYANCVNYGFILRYPANKTDKTGAYFNPNRFRYVGIENAKKMRAFDMCLDEYSLYIREQKI